MPVLALPAAAALALASCLGPGGPWLGPPRPGWLTPVGPPTTLLHGFAPPPAALPWLPGHRGVDLEAAPGAPVRADGSGVVAFAGSVAGVGVVTVEHGNGVRSTFEPVEASVHAGAAVRAGQLLGRIGAWWRLPVPGPFGVPAAHCGSPCLHWGMVRFGAYVDPLAVTGVTVGCRQVRLLPVDGVVPGPMPVAHPASPRAGRAAVAGSSIPMPPDSTAPGGPGGAAAAAAEASVVVGGAAAATLVAVRRRRLGGSGARPP
jgi:murein DD-endopeptidase MepM/ murein hydrolase activator NlpD